MLESFAQLVLCYGNHNAYLVFRFDFHGLAFGAFNLHILHVFAAIVKEVFEEVGVFLLNTGVLGERTLCRAALAAGETFENNAVNSVLGALFVSYALVFAVTPYLYKICTLLAVAGAFKFITPLVSEFVGTSTGVHHAAYHKQQSEGKNFFHLNYVFNGLKIICFLC